MKQIQTLIERYPDLKPISQDLEAAFTIWKDSYANGNKTLICGNGGSASDSEHIVGELMKGFISRRPVNEEFRQELQDAYGQHGDYLANHLQGALPAISLSSQTSLLTAYGNDVAFDMGYAQQVYGYGEPGDILIALSTSGNSTNIVHAAQIAKLRSLQVIGFTGSGGGKLAEICDVTIKIPDNETYRIQERHLAIYHTLCLMLEETFFPK